MTIETCLSYCSWESCIYHKVNVSGPGWQDDRICGSLSLLTSVDNQLVSIHVSKEINSSWPKICEYVGQSIHTGLPRYFPGLALEVLCSRNLLSARQTKMVGYPRNMIEPSLVPELNPNYSPIKSWATTLLVFVRVTEFWHTLLYSRSWYRLLETHLIYFWNENIEIQRYKIM